MKLNLLTVLWPPFSPLVAGGVTLYQPSDVRFTRVAPNSSDSVLQGIQASDGYWQRDVVTDALFPIFPSTDVLTPRPAGDADLTLKRYGQ